MKETYPNAEYAVTDCHVALAPSNPEKHLQYAKEVLSYGRRTHIYKTFAPDLATGQESFRIAVDNPDRIEKTGRVCGRYAAE